MRNKDKEEPIALITLICWGVSFALAMLVFSLVQMAELFEAAGHCIGACAP